MTQDYKIYQISSSEAMRAGSRDGLTTEEQIEFFEEAKKWSARAFLTAGTNVFFRYLSICQYTCAEGLILLARTGYDSQVVAGIPSEAMEIDMAEAVKEIQDLVSGN